MFLQAIRLDEADEGRNRFDVHVALQLCGMRLMREGWSVRSSVHPPRSFAYPRAPHGVHSRFRWLFVSRISCHALGSDRGLLP